MTTADHERIGYLRCNTLGHAWFDYDSTWKPQFGIATDPALRALRAWSGGTP